MSRRLSPSDDNGDDNDNDSIIDDNGRFASPSHLRSHPPPPPPTATAIGGTSGHQRYHYPHIHHPPSSMDANLMERVLFTLHERACNYGLRWTSARTRRWLEHCLLVGAIGCFGALLLLHRSFVVVSSSLPSSSPAPSNSFGGGNATTMLPVPTSAYNCLPFLPGFDPNQAHITHLIVLPAPSISQSLHRLLAEFRSSADGRGGRFHGIKSHNNIDIDHEVWKSRVIWRRPSKTRTGIESTVEDKNTEVDHHDSESHQSIHSQRPMRYEYYSYNDKSQIVNVSPDDPFVQALGHQGLPPGPRTTTEAKATTMSQSTVSPSLSSSDFVSHYVYSSTKALLMLPPDHALLDQLDVQYVFVSPSDQTCFGEPFIQFLIFYCFVGPETILRNWFQQSFLLQRHPQMPSSGNRDSAPSSDFLSDLMTNKRGYIYNTRTEKVQELDAIPWKRNAEPTLFENKDMKDSCSNDPTTAASSSQRWIKQLRRFLLKANTDGDQQHPFDPLLLFASLLSKMNVLLQTSFLFFFCTTLVSFTLRETQERMMDFTRELSRRVQQSLPVSDLIATHLIQNLVFVPIMVGMMFFLIEFYGGDKYLAFSISSIVWSVESFSIVSLRSTQGILYFPRFFFLLFLLFHVYQSAYSQTGFVYLALTVVWCFIFHSMVFFWHRFELPAVVFGYVSVDRPRMTLHSAPFSTNTSSAPTGTDQQHRPSEQRGMVLNNSASSNGAHLVSDRRTISMNGRGGPGVPSHPSFSTASSRNGISGLFRNNHDDDSSTGSMLYFMGGEVVVHRGAAVRTTSHGSVDGTNNSDAQSVSNGMNRTESTLSLPSTLSYGPGHATATNSSMGLDISENQKEDEYPDVSVGQPSSTLQASNFTPTRGQGRTADQLGDYADESGGLQAILESRLTPRHRNSNLNDRFHSLQSASDQGNFQQQHQPAGTASDSRVVAASAYQRTPPTFPELSDGDKKKC